MAMTAPKFSTGGGNSNYKPVPAGSHIATLIGVFDIGTHLKRSQQHGDKYKRQIVLQWELPDELIEVEFDGVKEDRPMRISKTMTFSMHENSELRPFVEGLAGRKLSDKEAAEYDFEALGGQPCQINVSHRDGTDRNGKPKTFADVASMSPISKRMSPPERVGDITVYSVDQGPPAEDLPIAAWLKEKILASQELKGSGQQQPERAKQVGDGKRFSEPGIDDETEDKFPWEGEGATVAPPNSGRALFAWVKDMEAQHEVALLKYLNSWGRLQEFPARIINWSTEQVHLAYAEAARKLNESNPSNREIDQWP